MYKRLGIVLLIGSCALGSSQSQSSNVSSVAFSTAGFVPGVEMSGTAIWHYGSDEQTGTATLTAFANGQSRIALQLSGGTRIETQSPFNDAARTCAWSGPDGVVHKTADHNCGLATVWFLPQVNMQPGAVIPDGVVSSAVASDGKTTVVHYERHPANVKDSVTANLLAELSAVDIGIDISTSLPKWLRFQIHPDNDAGTDMPVQVNFGDYRTMNGVTVPFHIQKLVNHALVLDLQIAAVQLQSAP